MTPVLQEIIDPGKGDCFSACIATLFDLPLAEVPKFRRDNPYPSDMMDAARAWVAEKFGLSLITIQNADFNDPDFTGRDMRFVGGRPETPCIAGGKSPNFEGVSHAVVGTIDGLGNFTMTHDPNPSGKGIIGQPTHIYLFVLLSLGTSSK